MGLKPAMRRALSLTLLAWVLGACAQEQAAQATAVEAEQALDTADSRYGFERPSRDGIGKIYMGREISHVMGHLGSGWLERPEREREERTDLLVAALPVEEDDAVADIGAGSGYFSFRVAERVPNGVVYAVDIQQEMLDEIERRTKGNPAAIEIFQMAIDNVRPNVEVRSKRVGGANYQVPMQVRPKRKTSLAFRWIIAAARSDAGKPMHLRLAKELMDASKREGKAMNQRDQTHRMADANKAFAHYRW